MHFVPQNAGCLIGISHKKAMMIPAILLMEDFAAQLEMDKDLH